MAPEALAERGSAGEQQDVFSLGALAYHLFSGQPPAENFYELTEKGGTQLVEESDAWFRLAGIIDTMLGPQESGR